MIHARPIPALALLALLSLAPVGRGQSQPGAEAQPVPLAVSQSELVLDQFPVQNVDPSELYSLAEELVGRKYFVKENGARAGASNNMRLLGSTIVVYDTKEQVQRAREVLTKLDAKREQASTGVQTIEYAPHFVSLETAVRAIGDVVDGYSIVTDRGLVVMRSDRASMDTALALLKRIDVPEKQVLLTCQIVDVGDSAVGLALSRELEVNLAKLLPDVRFLQAGMAMLKTSVRSTDDVSVQMEANDTRYRFSFRPVAYDEATSSLTVASCSLVEERPSADGGMDPRELFRTNTVLRGGEYTVLAATGATPRLLVVRVTPQG